jgi:hypothetical protein
MFVKTFISSSAEIVGRIATNKPKAAHKRGKEEKSFF